LLTASLSSAVAQDADTTQNNAIFYKITGNDLEKPSYLFGTIHLMCEDEEFSRAVIASAIASTESVLMEIDLSDMAGMLKKLAKDNKKKVDPERLKPFPEVLSASENELVEKTIEKYSLLPLKFMKRLPLEAVILVLSASPKAMGCTTPIASYELKIVDAAKSNQKKIAGLETFEQQLGFIPDVKNSDTKKVLLDSLSKFEERVDRMRKLREVYFRQNADQLFETATSDWKEDPKFQTTILDERNQAWVPKIESLLKNESIFLAVGAAHLGGDQGLLKLLRDRGYKLEPVRLKLHKTPQRSLDSTLPTISFSSTKPNSRLSELSEGLSPSNE